MLLEATLATSDEVHEKTIAARTPSVGDIEPQGEIAQIAVELGRDTKHELSFDCTKKMTQGLGQGHKTTHNGNQFQHPTSLANETNNNKQKDGVF